MPEPAEEIDHEASGIVNEVVSSEIVNEVDLDTELHSDTELHNSVQPIKVDKSCERNGRNFAYCYFYKINIYTFKGALHSVATTTAQVHPLQEQIQRDLTQTERKPHEGRERNKIQACPAHDG